MEYLKLTDTKLVLEAAKAAERGEIREFLENNPLHPEWVINSDIFYRVVENDDAESLRFLLTYCDPMPAMVLDTLRCKAKNQGFPRCLKVLEP